MKRRIISKFQLQLWLTEELQKLPEYKKCKFGGIAPLQEVDSDGCNWSASITLNAAEVPKEIYEPAALFVIQEARKKFNIAID